MNNLRAAKIYFFILTLILSGCVKKEQVPAKPAGPDQGALFSFNYGTVDALLLVKNDPNSPDHFSARMKKTSVNPLRWEIVNDPDSGPLMDRTADEIFIGHLLDTLTTLHVIQKLPENTPPENMGLAPPRFAIGFELLGTKHELLLGSETEQPKGSYGKTDVYSSNFILDGAAVGMFGYLKTFDTLRKKTVITFSMDEADKVSIQGKKYERMNTTWVDSKKHTHNQVDSFLETLTHLQIQKYIDDVKSAESIRDKITKQPDYRFEFEGRKLSSISFSAKKIGHDIFAMVSNRPGGVYQLFDESEKHLRLGE